MAQLDALVKRYNEDQEQEDFRVGLICAVIANVNRDPKKRRRVFKPQDFMPSKTGKKGQQGKLPTLEEMRLMNIVAGGKDIPQEEVVKDISMKEARSKMATLKETKDNG